MTVMLTCSQGHEWQIAENDSTAIANRPMLCPVCAAQHVTVSLARLEGVTTDDVEATTGPTETPPAAWPQFPEVPGYEILGVLGRGGMGVVYKAWQTSLKRTVALKMVLGGAHADEEPLARFKAEAEAAASLQHPNIVQIHEIAEHQGLPFFSLEYVGGGSLAGRLGGAPLPAEDAARLVETLARAVQAAHDRGIIHRDLKPANILLMDSNTGLADAIPKITDFGLAKRLDVESARTQSGAIMGTPSYMAPEQASGQAREAGPLADVYALGAILYECLTGRPPFRAATPLETVRQVVEEEPVPPRRLQPRTPRDLETICLKCLRKEPERRYVSATALADDLYRFLAHEPIDARPVALPERIWKWSRRRPAAAALLALSLLTVLGTTVGISAYLLELQNRAEEDRIQKRIADELRQKAEDGEKTANAAKELAQNETKRANDAATKERLAAQKEREATANAIRSLYDLRVYRVTHAIEEGRHGTATEELGRMHPFVNAGHDLRSFEWFYWDRLLNAHVKHIPHATKSDLLATIYSPHGRLLIYGDGITLTFVSPESGRFRGSAPSLYSLNDLAFSPDGRFLAASGGNSTVHLYDFGRPENEWPNDDKAMLRPTLHRLQAHSSFVRAVAFSPQGDLFASAGSDGLVVLWNPLERKLVKTLYGPRNGFQAVAFRPDGLRLAAAHAGGIVHVWELPSYKRLETLKMPGSPIGLNRLAYSPSRDFHWLVAADTTGRVHQWSAETGYYERVFPAHKQTIRALRFNADGSQLVTAGEDRMIVVWDGRFFYEQAHFIGHSSTITSVAFRPDGRQIVSADKSGDLKFWDPARNPMVTSLPRPISPIAGISFSSDARNLAAVTRTGDLEIWNVDERKRNVEKKGVAKELFAVCWIPWTNLVAVAGSDGKIQLFNGKRGENIQTLAGHKGPIFALACSPDGTLLTSGGEDGVIRVWHMHTGKTLHVLPGHPRQPPRPGMVHGLAFHPDGKRLASVGHDSMLRFWDVVNGSEQSSHTVSGFGLECVCFNATGDHLAYGSSADSVLRWCPLKEGFADKSIRYLSGHQQPLVGVAFTPDGKRLLSASRDGTIRFWNTTTFQEMLSLGGLWKGATALALSNDGHYLAAASFGGEILIWNATPRN